MKAKILGFAVVLATFAAGALAAEISPPGNLVNPGKLTYGTAATYAPFEYMESGEYTGFDVDMAKLLAARMGLQPQIMGMDFKGLIPALDSKRIDIINSGMYVNEDRKKRFELVPYLRLGQEMVVQKGNPAHLGGREDLCGKKVGVTLGAMQEVYARATAKQCEAAGKPTVDVMTFPTAQDSALAVMQKRADALFIATPGAIKLVSERPDTFEVVGKTFAEDTLIAMVLRPDDPQMKQAITQALASIKADGSFDRLMDKYKFPAVMRLQ